MSRLRKQITDWRMSAKLKNYFTSDISVKTQILLWILWGSLTIHDWEHCFRIVIPSTRSFFIRISQRLNFKDRNSPNHCTPQHLKNSPTKISSCMINNIPLCKIHCLFWKLSFEGKDLLELNQEQTELGRGLLD